MGSEQGTAQQSQARRRFRTTSFDFDSAHYIYDDTGDYGEERWAAIGLIHFGMYLLVFTDRDDDVIRVISLRKATKEEIRLYVESENG